MWPTKRLYYRNFSSNFTTVSVFLYSITYQLRRKIQKPCLNPSSSSCNYCVVELNLYVKFNDFFKSHAYHVHADCKKKKICVFVFITNTKGLIKIKMYRDNNIDVRNVKNRYLFYRQTHTQQYVE